MVTLGCAAGLILLPVLLSLVGPVTSTTKLKDSDDVNDGEQQGYQFNSEGANLAHFSEKQQSCASVYYVSNGGLVHEQVKEEIQL